MFALRALAAALSVFAACYVLLSITVATSWRLLIRMRQTNQPWLLRPSLLYFLRMLPLLGASVATFAFEVPSFLLLEPRGIDERFGPVPAAAGLCALLFVAGAVGRAVYSCRRTSGLARRWAEGGRRLQEHAGVPVIQSGRTAPPVAVTGVFAPRVMVSSSVLSVLSREELNGALAHEEAHVRQHDNLKRLLLLLCWFPGMRELERAWAEASEFNADQAAVKNRQDALNLAAALVKIARTSDTPIDARALVANLTGTASTTVQRVERLIHWSARPKTEDHSLAAVLAGTALLLTAVSTYPEILAGFHRFTEFLFR